MGKLRCHKSVRIVNPASPFHTVRLFPCQKMVLKLRAPIMFIKNVSASAEFNVSLAGNMMIMEKSEKDLVTGDLVFTFNQKYDLSEWQNWGEVSLGEINITIENNTHKEKQDFKCTLCLIQIGDPRILTVVNPYGNEIKLDSNQILEIVSFDTTWSKKNALYDKFQSSITHKKVENVRLEQIRYEVAGNQSPELRENLFWVANRYGLKINPRLSTIVKDIVQKEIESQVPPVREHHWWYTVSKDTLKRIVDFRDGEYQVGKIDIDGECAREKYPRCWNGVEVMLSVKGKKKHKMHPYYLNENSIEHKMEIGKRSKNREILTNPLCAELIDFKSGDIQELEVEIVQPSAFWTDLADDVRWEFSVEKHTTTGQYVRIVPASDYIRWGKLFQRFKITHTYCSFGNSESVWLGAINIICKEKIDSHDGIKRISCWFAPEKKKATVPVYNGTSVPMVEKPTSSTSSVKTCYGKKKDKDYNGTPRVYVVQFEEVVGELEDLVTTRAIADISTPRSHTSYCNFPQHEYLLPKKKEILPTTTISLKESDNKKEGKESEKKNGLGESTKNGKLTDWNKPALIIFNPENLYEATIEQGQSLIVRMDMPQKIAKASFNQEIWAVQFVPNCEGLKLDYSKVITVEESGSFSLYQEVKVSPNPNPITGVHFLGKLIFSCSGQSRVVSVLCKNVASVLPTEINISQPYKIFDGEAGARKLFVNNWCHGDGILFSYKEAVYVRNPAHSSTWLTSSWQMDVLQYKLPDAVWQHELLKDVLKDIDIQNPWFPTSTTLKLYHTYIFRPLTMQQPHIEKILRAVADVLSVDVLPIAQLVFKNSKHPDNFRVVSPYGVMESVIKTERCLGLCLSLAEFKDKEIVVDNPIEKDEVIVNGGTLVVKFEKFQHETERGGVVNCSWYIADFPRFLELKGQKDTPGGREFRFKVRHGYDKAIGTVRFVGGNRTRNLVAKYESKK